MLKKVILLFAVLSGSASAQSVTPNIGLQLPSYNSSNWGTQLNYDLTRLDGYLSGGYTIPNLSISTLTTPTVNATVNGYQINGTAPLNHFLIGNGTYYVDTAQIPAGSLPSSYTNFQLFGTPPFIGFAATAGGTNTAGITTGSNVFDFGNGTLGDKSGTLNAAILNATGSVTTPVVNGSVNGVFNVKASPYNATGNGTTDDTVAIKAAIAAAKVAGLTSTPTGVYFPAGTYLISSSLDVSGLNVSCAGRFQTTVKMSSTVQQDVFQTQGNTKIADCGINGGWNGTTTGLTGNGISTLSSPGAAPAYYGYQNVFSDLYVLDTNKYCIYINDGAYESLHDIKCNASGLDGIYLDSGNYSGYQTTTISVSGQSTFSDTPNGFGVVINNGIDISFTGVTTIENTQGVEILGGNNRNINLSGIYQEGNTGKWLTAAGSAGYGLNVENDFGPGTTGTTYADVSGWPSYTFTANDFLNPGSRAVPISILGSTNIDPINNLYGDWTFNTTTATSLGVAPITSTSPWNATFTGNWVTATAHPKPAQNIEISNNNPTIVVGTTTFTFSVSSGGIFQGIVTTPGSGSGSFEFIGTIHLTSDKQEGTNSNLALQTADGIQVGTLTATASVTTPLLTVTGGSPGVTTPIVTGNDGVTFTADAGAGTSPTVACATGHVCNATSGTIAITTGTTPTAGSGVVTGTFSTALTNIPSCAVSGGNSATALLSPYIAGETTGLFVVYFAGTQAASTAYQVKYACGD